MADSLQQVLSTFQTINDERGDDDLLLRNVWYLHTDGCLEQVILRLGEMFLTITADEDDDAVIVSKSSNPDFDIAKGEDATNAEPWVSLVEKSLGWGWATVNQQGYCDGIMLSFAGIQPQVCLNVMASSIKIAAIGGFSER